MIRLLEPVSDATKAGASQLVLLGKKWTVCDYAVLSDAPEYTCVSYAWGEDRTENPFSEGPLISARAIRALETAIIATQSQATWAENIDFDDKGDPIEENAKQKAAVTASQALWVDMLSVPTAEPARTSCLQRMGAIYSKAYQVVVILDAQSAQVLEAIGEQKTLDNSALSLLEQEAWLDRAWTYQEAVNSRHLYFIAEGGNPPIFNGVGK